MKSKKMQFQGGLAGKILWVDLDAGKTWTEDTDRYASRWLGGRTINSYILLNEMKQGIKWSDPQNILIFGAGCLVGTAIGSSRLSIDTQSVFSNGKGSANVGGHFAAEMKFAGFDHIVIRGKAEKPVYLWLNDGRAEIRDAGFIWGKSVFETEELLQRELGDKKIRMACIGPAGENLVRGSAIMVDRAKAAGGSGVGCVMGDKKIKAIVARGRGSLRIADPEAFLKATDVAIAKIKSQPMSKRMAREGLAFSSTGDPAGPAWEQGRIFRNGQDEFFPMEKRVRLVDKNHIPSYVQKMLACFQCPIGCMMFCEIPDGAYKGMKGEGFWANSFVMATMLDMPNPDALLAAWWRMNALGLDTDFTTAMIAWAFECFEKGLLTKEQADGLDLEWGNTEAICKLIEKIAYRDGIGDLLANGSVEAAAVVGGGSDLFAIHLKGQPSIERFRVPRGWALGIATSPVGGRHLRGGVLGPENTGPKGASFDPLTCEKQAEAVHWQALTKEIEDTIGMCVYVGTWCGAHALEISDYVALINSIMGTGLTEDELMHLAAKGRNLEVAINRLQTDLNRSDDYPPKRYMLEPIKSGKFAGRLIEAREFDRMLDEYYAAWGWSKETGLQTYETFARLEMEDIADKLVKAGKLSDKE